MIDPPHKKIAYFISPHGYGHAARASAVMESLLDLDPDIRFQIFSTIPAWFFETSLSGKFEFHSLETDIGLVQKTPLQIDLLRTVEQLNRFLPFKGSQVKGLAEFVRNCGCRLVLCDIAPLGIAVAKRAGIPAVLLENFTWDWIYEGYLKQDGDLEAHISYLEKLFSTADVHIQTEPVCSHLDVDLVTNPISRRKKLPADAIRGKLGIPKTADTVMITLGGIREQYPFLTHLKNLEEFHFIIPGASDYAENRDNLVLLPHRSDYFHPDLVSASDAVIGKVGYSTLAEVYYAGVPFGYVAREGFRESKPLVAYIEHEMHGLAIDEGDFYKGSWTTELPRLLSMPRIDRDCTPGAEQAARFIYNLVCS